MITTLRFVICTTDLTGHRICQAAWGEKKFILDTLNLTCLCDTQMITFRAENLRLKREVLCGYFIKLLMPTAVTSELEVT